MSSQERIGSWSKDFGDGNENGKNPVGLDWQTTTLHVHHAFLYISLPSLHDYDVKVPNFETSRFVEDVNQDKRLYFSWTLIQSFRIQLQNSLPTIDELNEME